MRVRDSSAARRNVERKRSDNDVLAGESECDFPSDAHELCLAVCIRLALALPSGHCERCRDLHGLL